MLRVAASDLGTDCPPLVCTEGMPSAACHKLLGSAVAQGTRLHWRADFDWTGLRIVGAAITSHRARPWRMTAADYRHALDMGKSTPLTGTPTASPWDPELAARRLGTAARSWRSALSAVLLTRSRPHHRSSIRLPACPMDPRARSMSSCPDRCPGIGPLLAAAGRLNSVLGDGQDQLGPGCGDARAGGGAPLGHAPRVDGQDGRPFWPSRPLASWPGAHRIADRTVLTPDDQAALGEEPGEVGRLDQGVPLAHPGDAGTGCAAAAGHRRRR